VAGLKLVVFFERVFFGQISSVLRFKYAFHVGEAGVESVRIHDWARVYWQNAQGERVYNPGGIDPPDDVLALYENDAGERSGYRYVRPQEDDVSDSDEYVVTYQGEVVRDVTLDDERFKSGDFEVLAFGTRREVREASTAFRNTLEPIPVDVEAIEDLSWEDMLALARPRGWTQNDGRQAIVEWMVGLPGVEESVDVDVEVGAEEQEAE
jgi:hypothetical protein